MTDLEAQKAELRRERDEFARLSHQYRNERDAARRENERLRAIARDAGALTEIARDEGVLQRQVRMAREAVAAWPSSMRKNAHMAAATFPAAPAQPAQSDALERDALRYRWLRDIERINADQDGAVYVRRVQVTSGTITGSWVLIEEDLDAAIDAALEHRHD